MSGEININNMGTHIHVKQYGDDNYGISLDLWRKIVAACDQYQCYNILGESFTEKSLSTIDCYDHAKIFKIVGVSFKHRVAWVHHTEDPEGTAEFIDLVLKNRGLLNGAFFPGVKEATAWLLGEGKE
nr:hypothetical protein [Bacteroidota bacterium]